MKLLRSLPILIPLLLLAAAPAALAAAGSFLLKGHVVNSAGNAVQGAEVFLYDSAQVRRPADFISQRTDGSGAYLMELPSGKYWAVARVRSATFRPQMGVALHSGEAVVVEAAAGEETVLDFTVAEVRELAKAQRKPSSDLLKVEGRLLDRDGHPVPGAYAFAYPTSEGTAAKLPQYLSASSDATGSYTLYLPAGSYCLGGATAFPPEDAAVCEQQKVDGTKIGIAIDLRLKYLNSRSQEGRSGGEILDD